MLVGTQIITEPVGPCLRVGLGVGCRASLLTYSAVANSPSCSTGMSTCTKNNSGSALAEDRGIEAIFLFFRPNSFSDRVIAAIVDMNLSSMLSSWVRSIKSS
jgi:hypothetical protein